jgi:phosphate transport system substrate-binding protein
MKAGMFRALCALVLCTLPMFAHAQNDDVERLRIHGSNTMGTRLVPALVESWLTTIGYEGIRRVPRGSTMLEIHARRDGAPLIVEIGKRGSASGIEALVDGRAELAMMLRAPTAAELDAAWQLGDLRAPGQEFVVAVDGVAAVVHASNPVRRLDVMQLRDVYAGRITNWRELGGPDRPIRALTQSGRTAATEFLEAEVMRGAALAASVMRDADAARRVAADPTAIAIVPLRSRVPAAARPLAVSDGGIAVYPTRAGIHSEDYPLLRRYSLHGGQMMSALGRSFALFSMTRPAQQAVERAGHFAVMLRPAPRTPVLEGSEAYRRLMANAERLPLSLRFNHDANGSLFDPRAEYDLERVTSLLKQPRYRDREVVVVAFGHGSGQGELIPTLISNDRADIVVGHLHGHGIRVRGAHGFGTERMLAGAGHRAARFRNERVEIWVL